MRQISQQLLVAGAALDDAASVDVRRLALEEVIHYVKWSDAVTAGEVSIEGAGHPDDPAPWAVLGKVTFDPASTQQNYLRTTGNHAAFKHRVSVPIPEGSVTTKIAG